MSVSCLNFAKNLTRWLGFLTVVKHSRFGTDFVLWVVQAGRKARRQMRKNKHLKTHKIKNN